MKKALVLVIAFLMSVGSPALPVQACGLWDYGDGGCQGYSAPDPVNIPRPPRGGCYGCDS
jgi:hypothetical protein